MGSCPEPRPQNDGCHIFLPSGCAVWTPASAAWYKDTMPKSKTYDGCAYRAKTSYDQVCGTTDAIFFFVSGGLPATNSPRYGDARLYCQQAQEVICPEPRPHNDGCYIFTPSGCPKPAWTPANAAWYRDTWGRSTYDGCAARAKTGADSYDHWCGTTDVIFLFVSAGVSAPRSLHDGDARQRCQQAPSLFDKTAGQQKEDVHDSQKSIIQERDPLMSMHQEERE